MRDFKLWKEAYQCHTSMSARTTPETSTSIDDQIVPIGASALMSSKIVSGATLKVYPGLSRGMCSINKDQINTDLLAFIKS